MSRGGNLTHITDSGDVSFINSVVKVGTKKSELSSHVDKWLRDHSHEFPEIEFYIVDVATFDDDDSDPMLGDLIHKFKTLPVILFYHNNSLVASISEFNESNFVPALTETITEVLPPISRRIVDHSYVNDILKQKIEHSGERGPLKTQPPIKSKKPQKDISVHLDKFAKR